MWLFALEMIQNALQTFHNVKTPWHRVKNIFYYSSSNICSLKKKGNECMFLKCTSWYRGIHKNCTHLLCCSSHVLWNWRVDGAGVNEEGAFLHLSVGKFMSTYQNNVISRTLSMTKEERESYLRMPFGPVYTSTTLGLDGSIVIIRSALSATSAGLSTIWENAQESQR